MKIIKLTGTRNFKKALKTFSQIREKFIAKYAWQVNQVALFMLRKKKRRKKEKHKLL